MNRIMKNCLTCKYEPDWSDWIGVDYKRRIGACKYPILIPKLPSVYVITRRKVIRYSDNSGIETMCKVWEPKD